MVEDYGYFYDTEGGEYIINGEKYFPIVKPTGIFPKKYLYNLPNCKNILPNLPTIYEYKNEYQNKKFDKRFDKELDTIHNHVIPITRTKNTNANTYMIIHTIDKNVIFQFILYVLCCTILIFITIQVIV